MGIRILADRYELLDEIGRGGMAVVWRAHDRRLDRVVAVKIPRAEWLDDVMVRRVEREARMAAGISHPNVVTVYDSGIVDGEPYVVMELVDGRPLSGVIGDLDPLEARQAAVELADGLAAIHAAGVIHRDIKPGNVVMSPSGAKLTDFGIARRDESDRLTQPHQVMGTPAYVAPEVLAGARAGPAADVFSLGVVVAEMITGDRPTDRIPPLETGDSSLDELLQSTLVPEPGARPTAAEFAAALRSGRLSTIPIPAVTGPVERPPESSPGESPDPTQQLAHEILSARSPDRPGHRGRRVAAVAAVLVAASMFGAYAWMSANATDPPESTMLAATTIPTVTITIPDAASSSTSTAPTTTPTTAPPRLVSTPEQAAADLAAWALQIRPNELKPKQRRELVAEVDKVLEAHQDGEDHKLGKPFEKLWNVIDDLDSDREEGLQLLTILAEAVGFDMDDQV